MVLVSHDRVNGNATPRAARPDSRAIQPALREFSAAALYKSYKIPYHPGALKYFKDHNVQAKAIQ